MIRDLFLSFFEISLSTGLIVILLILFSAFLNKRYAAKWKYWIWIFLALRLILPFSGIEGLSVGEVGTQGTAPTGTQSVNDQIETPSEGIGLPQQIVVEVPAQMTTPIQSLSETKHADITLLDIAAVIWFLGSVLFIVIHLFSYLCYKRQIKKRGIVIEDANVLGQVQELQNELQIKCRIAAVEYSDAASPMMIGFLRPVLVLPKEQYSQRALSFIMKHELIHLKRRDVYFKLLFVVANALHWFNPVIWLMRREAFVDMELSCDERVIKGADYTVKKAYTETLFTTLHRKCEKRTALSTQFYGGTKIMKRRFLNILARTTKKNGILLLTGAIVLTISLGTLVGCSAAEPKRTVEENSGAGSGQVAEGMVMDGIHVPDVVLEKAKEIVAAIYLYDKALDTAYNYSNWRIESLEYCYTYEDLDSLKLQLEGYTYPNLEGMALQVYRMNYEFLSDTPENLILAGGSYVTEDGWCVLGYPNSQYLLFLQDGDSFSFLALMFINDGFPGDSVFTEALQRRLPNYLETKGIKAE